MLLAYDISLASTKRLSLVGEWVVPLPLDSYGEKLPANELHYIKDGVFLVLARDNNGPTAELWHYQNISRCPTRQRNRHSRHLVRQSEPPIAPNGVLSSCVVPAIYVGFVNYLDSKQLARFSLHDGDPSSQALINAKWESLTLAPMFDPAAPDDFFLFTTGDNDFMSTHGIFGGEPFDAGLDNDDQFLVLRVTLPGGTNDDLIRSTSP
ncbi:hypothetical protein H4582DRAFT_2096708 [Lactarius indigo]|nr:hypothetical protein H4582DRAFT_2096708 [Lactarius indigo]